VLAARRAAEGATRAALDGLGVFVRDKPAHLDVGQATLRNGLRAKWRQLGEDRELLVAECAYEQWHRLLFARFLAENNLLLHPEYKAPVTLTDCQELAAELGESDGWSVAARFAAEILPGIFRLDDPCFRLRLAPEGRDALERILDALPADTFVADDALGWVYQFWQKDKKDEVNDSERKIGGADLGPVTQLFTENYMVRFLLENSLGAWWAVRHPDSQLIKGFDYLRFEDDRRPAAGSFDGWPDCVAEVTVMDPCCGSGHFLVAAFSMLWQMRAEEEGLTPVNAQDAVLRENLFGLELDPRCVQIAMFAVALQAWKAGGAWRQLPVPNIACSGIPVKAPVEEWTALASGDQRLENALARLHVLFRDADTLGSLVDPRRAVEAIDPLGRQASLDELDWEETSPRLLGLMSGEMRDPAMAVLGSDAVGVMRAAELLGRGYTLVVTNVPYLVRAKQVPLLQKFAAGRYLAARADLATMFLRRLGDLVMPGGTDATVTPQNWLFLSSYTAFRREMLADRTWHSVARVGSGATASKSWDTLRTLLIASNVPPQSGHRIATVDSVSPDDEGRARELTLAALGHINQRRQVSNPDSRIVFADLGDAPLLETVATSSQGISPADTSRFRRQFWEVTVGERWVAWQRPVAVTEAFGGRDSVLEWSQALFSAVERGEAFIRGQAAWGKRGVAVRQVGHLPATLYTGERFDTSCAVIVPADEGLMPALWAFVRSQEFGALVRQLDRKLNVTNATLAKVPFDVDRWREVAEKAGSLPEPWSDQPTQWLFEGRPELSTAPLQVAVARLVGYWWPEQASSDELDGFADGDGIVCLPSVAGEAPAADRVQQVLTAAFGERWSPATAKELLEQAGSKKKNIADWMADEFFKQHCALFGNRPFVWHIWDGMRDGFSALVNYHRLDRKALEKLTYTYLGQDWVERQRAAARDEVAGAEARLSAALNLRQKLEAILEGEKPFDIYVRWKELHEQPIGWDPDLNDGVRLNIRPFVEADVLRSPFNIHWKKDRGKNPDGSERHNNIHLSLAEKQDARAQTGRA
jgi:hypothetical protein